MKKYDIIDHTADIGINAYGSDLKELFCNAALGMFGILVSPKPQIPSPKSESKKIYLKINKKASNIEELLVEWLRELLYQYNSSQLVCNEFSMRTLTQDKIEAEVQAEKFDPQLYDLGSEIKAVTYHELEVRKDNSGWQAQVIFDV